MVPERLEVLVSKRRFFLADAGSRTWSFVNLKEDVEVSDSFFREGNYEDSLDSYSKTFKMHGVLPADKIVSDVGCSIADCYGLLSLTDANNGIFGRAIMNGRSEVRIVENFLNAFKTANESGRYGSALMGEINKANARLAVSNLRLAGHYFRSRKKPSSLLNGHFFNAIEYTNKGIKILNILCEYGMADDFLLFRAGETIMQLADKLALVSRINSEMMNYRVCLYETALDYIGKSKNDGFSIVNRAHMIAGLAEKLATANSVKYSDRVLDKVLA